MIRFSYLLGLPSVFAIDVAALVDGVDGFWSCVGGGIGEDARLLIADALRSRDGCTRLAVTVSDII